MTRTLDNEVDIHPWRAPLVAGVAVAAILVLSTIIIDVINAVSYIRALSGTDVGNYDYFGGLGTEAGFGVVRGILFGVGVVLALRFFASIPLRAGWRHMVSRILFAAGGGAAILFVAFVAAALVAAFSPGQYPFGYDFQPSFDGYSMGNGILSALISGLLAFVSGVPVVGLVILWRQLFRRDAA